TNSKVAARSGQNKALIAYHFGAKDGLVAAVAREVSAAITEELLEGIGEPRTVADVARGVVDGVARIMARDEGLARLYFDLAWHGAGVTLAVRNTERGEAAAEKIEQEVPEANVEPAALDLADLASIREFAAGQTEPLDILVNNAGVMALPRRTTKDGFEMHI